MDTVVLSWRPTNILTIGLMVGALVLGYALVAQGTRYIMKNFGDGK